MFSSFIYELNSYFNYYFMNNFNNDQFRIWIVIILVVLALLFLPSLLSWAMLCVKKIYPNVFQFTKNTNSLIMSSSSTLPVPSFQREIITTSCTPQITTISQDCAESVKMGRPMIVFHPQSSHEICSIIHDIVKTMTMQNKCMWGNYEWSPSDILFVTRQIISGIRYRIIMKRGERFIFLDVVKLPTSTSLTLISMSIVQPCDFRKLLNF